MAEILMVVLVIFAIASLFGAVVSREDPHEVEKRAYLDGMGLETENG